MSKPTDKPKKSAVFEIDKEYADFQKKSYTAIATGLEGMDSMTSVAMAIQQVVDSAFNHPETLTTDKVKGICSIVHDLSLNICQQAGVIRQNMLDVVGTNWFKGMDVHDRPGFVKL